VPDNVATPVVLLYVHPLLGQGLAQHVHLATGLDVLAISAADAVAVSTALELHPRVVIFERYPGLDESTLRCLVADAMLIDVSDAVAPAGSLVPVQGQPPQPEVIVALVDRAYATA
jgi:hypothetical protein